jgi:hypothetical protein
VDTRQRGVCRARALARADIPRNPRAADRPRHLRPRAGAVEGTRRGHGTSRRHGGLIRDAIEQAAESSETDHAQLAEQRASVAKEIARAQRAIERYQDAFENGALDPVRFKERLSTLDTRLDALQAQDQALARELATEAPTTPDTAALNAVADQLAHVIATGDSDQTKALLRILIADLHVNSRREILPTYRVGAPVVCAQTSSMGETWQRANQTLLAAPAVGVAVGRSGAA